MYLLSHTISESQKSGSSLSKCYWVSGLSWGCTLAVCWGCFVWRLDWGWRIHLQEDSLTWKEEEGFRAWHTGLSTRLLECPHNMVAGFPPEWVIQERARRKPQWLSWPSTHSGPPLLLSFLLIRSEWLSPDHAQGEGFISRSSSSRDSMSYREEYCKHIFRSLQTHSGRWYKM